MFSSNSSFGNCRLNSFEILPLAEGYSVKTGITVTGKCVDHEVDVVSENTVELNMMECKFHSTQKTYCSVQHSLYIRARFWDIESRREHDNTDLSRKFSGWLVTNTRFSMDAISYGTCSGLKMMSWDFPLNSSLKDRIDKFGLHPVTSVVSLSHKEKQKLLAMNIVLCQSLNAQILGSLGITDSRIPDIIRESENLCRRSQRNIKSVKAFMKDTSSFQMKTIKVLVLLVLIQFGLHAQQEHPSQALKARNSTNSTMDTDRIDQQIYTCPMHPEVKSATPGNCPRCGMKLVPIDNDEMHNSHGKMDMEAKNPEVIPLLPKKNLKGGKVVKYDLYVKDTVVTFGRKPRRAIAVNGQIPMPTLTFTEGDTAVIVVHNMMDEETSLHWHGVMLPNKEDGVPWLTQKPIKPHSTYTYSFPIIQTGTHWYHSHSGLQEQIGMYGPFIMKKRQDDPTFRKGIDDLPAIPLILSEWTNLNPNNVHRMLHNANDWFAIKKGSTQSYLEAIKEGHFKTKVTNEWKRMLAMDVSDVYYNKFLINGADGQQFSQFKAGDKVRLRIANGGASSYFWLNYAGGKFMVVANDGNDVEPVEVDRLIIGVSETYDIVVTIPQKEISYQLLITPEDRTKSTSIYIGEGVKQVHSPLPKLKYFEGMKMMNDMMKMNGDMKDMGMNMRLQVMDMNAVMYPEITGNQADNKMQMDEAMDHSGHNMGNPDIVTLNYDMLKSPYNTELPKDQPVKELTFTLTGNMNRYVWSLDNKVLSEVDKIPVKKGEILRITLINNSMMRHPMHLHGFDFRILNSHGLQSPLKNVIDIMPMEKDTIEFAASTEGDWFFHCHILYHMMAGMNRVFEVGDYQNPELPDKQYAYKKLQRESNQLHLMAENDFATNGNDGRIMLQNARWSFGTEWRLGYNDRHGYETETHIGRYIGKMQWFMPFVGFDWRFREFGSHEIEKNIFGQKNFKNKRAALSAGFVYTLPMLIDFQAEVFTDGILRLQLRRADIPLTPRLRGAFFVNTDKEYMGGFKYILTKNTAFSTYYDSDMGWGGGLILSY